MPLLAHHFKYLRKFRSTNRSEVEVALDRECRKFHWLRDCLSWREYVDTRQARALTPSALLEEAGVVAASIFALLLDATGGCVDHCGHRECGQRDVHDQPEVMTWPWSRHSSRSTRSRPPSLPSSTGNTCLKRFRSSCAAWPRRAMTSG
eukprot:UN3159